MTDHKERFPDQNPPPYAYGEYYCDPSPYGAAESYGGPSPYATAQSYASPSPYGSAESYASPSPSASPSPYGGPVPYGGPTTDERPHASLGWSMWRFDGSSWELMDDRSALGASPSVPDSARGQFVGQIVRTPSIMLQERAPLSGSSVVDSEYAISEIVRRAGEVPGYASDAELRWIVGTAAALQAGSTWVEVGAMCGRSFLAAGLSLPQGSTLITVDRYLGQHIRRGQTILETYLELSTERSDLQLVMTRSDSVSAARLFPNQSCSAVYIDADHSGPAVRADVHAWTPKLVPGGMLCGHDYGRPEYSGLTRAVDELPGSATAVDSIWVWYP